MLCTVKQAVKPQQIMHVGIWKTKNKITRAYKSDPDQNLNKQQNNLKTESTLQEFSPMSREKSTEPTRTDCD